MTINSRSFLLACVYLLSAGPSLAQHGGISGGMRAPTGGQSSGAGSQSSLLELNMQMQQIEDMYGDQRQQAVQQLLQGNAALTQCALQEQTALDDAQGRAADMIASNQVNPLMEAMGAAGPGLMSAATNAMGNSNQGKQLAQSELDPAVGTFNYRAKDVFENPAHKLNNMPPPTLNKETGQVSNAAAAFNPGNCSQADDPQACKQDLQNLQQYAMSARPEVIRLNQDVKQGGIFNAELLTSVASGAITYFGARQQQKQVNESAKRMEQGAANSAAAARQMCEQGAQAMIQAAQSAIANTDQGKRRAMDNLALAASQPLPLDYAATDVPVADFEGLGLGPGPIIGSAENFSDPDNPFGANNDGDGAGPNAPGGGGGGGPGGGAAGLGAPQWTFAEGGGFPGGGGLPAQPGGGKFAAIDGGGSKGGGGFGGLEDPFGAFGFDGDLNGDGSADRSLAGQMEALGDGGLRVLMARARMRYGLQAATLLRNVDLKEMAKNTESMRERAPAKAKDAEPEFSFRKN